MLHHKLCIFLLSSCCILFTSCGFHVVHRNTPLQTLQIPYCKGDRDGLFTAALIEAIEKKGVFLYTSHNARYQLIVELLDKKSETIGYRNNPKKSTENKQKLIPDEGRIRILAEVKIIDNSSGKITIGPLHIEASCDFDHENYTVDHDANRFSLGQFTDIDTAYDVIEIPLYRNLAKNIAAYLEDAATLLPSQETKKHLE